MRFSVLSDRGTPGFPDSGAHFKYWLSAISPVLATLFERTSKPRAEPVQDCAALCFRGVSDYGARFREEKCVGRGVACSLGWSVSGIFQRLVRRSHASPWQCLVS